MRLDLHIHTRASDGAWSPAQVIRQAHAGGLHVVAVTDHDTTAGLDEARRVAEDVGIRLVAGCELSSTHQGRDVHILGYGVDPDARALREHEARAGERRLSRMAEMVERLASQGVRVSLERVLEVSGDEGVVGRPHLAQVLVEEGYAQDLPDAFDRLIGDSQPAFVATALHTPVDAIQTVLASGGLPVWAHPPGDQLDELLPTLVEAGLKGLEAYRPGHAPRQTRRLLDRAQQAGLVVSGGSDWHDPDRHQPLGAFHVLERQVEALMVLLDAPG